MFKVFVFAAILAFAFAVPAPEPKPQILVAGGLPVVSPVIASEVIVPGNAQYTLSGVVAPVVAPGVVIV